MEQSLAVPSDSKERRDIKYRFQKGVSGNPGGKPVGSRNAINQKFLAALSDTWEKHGQQALEKVAKKDPATFVRVVASLQPKEIDVTNHLGEISDEQLEAVYLTARAVLAGQNLRTGNVLPGEAQPTEEVQTLPQTVDVP